MKNFKDLLAPALRTAGAIPLKTRRALRDAIRSNAKALAQENRQQLFEGKDSTGASIEPPYKPFTVMIKKRKGQPVNRVTLRDTGDFYKSIRVIDRAADFEYIATDPKTRDLEIKYGDNILGLASSSFDKLKPQIIKDIIDQLRKDGRGT